MLQLYKEAYAGHPKEVWALAGLTFINRMGTMVLPFLTVYLTTVLTFEFSTAGIIASAFGFGSFFGSYYGGKLSSKIGANNVIMLSLFIGGLFFIFLQFFTSFYGLFIMIFLTSMFGEAYRPAMTTAIGDYVPKSATGRSMSLIRLAINLGMASGPMIGGFVAISLGYNWLFWLDGLTCILAAFVFGAISRHWKKQNKTASETEKTIIEDEDIPIPPLKNKNYILFLVGTFFIGFVFIQWFHSLPVFLKSNWNLEEDAIGILIGASCWIIVVIEMPLIHSIEKAGKIRSYILYGVFLIGVSYLLFLLSGSFWIALIAITIWTIGEIIFMPLNSATPINMSEKSNRGEYMSYFWMTWSVVNIVAPIVGLSFMDFFGYDAFWWFLFGLSLISLGINWKLNQGLK
jgi:predicted MFS family arabinose efflux permease